MKFREGRRERKEGKSETMSEWGRREGEKGDGNERERDLSLGSGFVRERKDE